MINFHRMTGSSVQNLIKNNIFLDFFDRLIQDLQIKHSYRIDRKESIESSNLAKIMLFFSKVNASTPLKILQKAIYNNYFYLKIYNFEK